MLTRRFSLCLPILLAILLLGVSCKPAQQPAPAPVQNQPPAAAKSGSTSAEDAAWAQVVAAAKKEGKVTLYTWGMAGQPGVKVAKAFKDAYGIDMETVTGEIPALIERMKSEQASKIYTADTFDASASSVLMVKDAGLTRPINDLPALKQKNSFRSDPIVDQDGHLAYLSVNYQSNIVNTTLVKAGQEPKSYRELADPKWKGKVVISSPIVAPGFNRVYALKEQLGLDDDYFKKLAQNGLVVAATDKDAVDMVVRGEASVTPLMMSTASPAAAKGAPIKGVWPTEGTILGSGNTISNLKNAPHPNASRLLINWLLSPEGQKVYGDASAFTPIRKDVTDFMPALLAVPDGVKVVVSDIATEGKVATLRQQKVLAKLMGIEK